MQAYLPYALQEQLVLKSNVKTPLTYLLIQKMNFNQVDLAILKRPMVLEQLNLTPEQIKRWSAHIFLHNLIKPKWYQKPNLRFKNIEESYTFTQDMRKMLLAGKYIIKSYITQHMNIFNHLNPGQKFDLAFYMLRLALSNTYNTEDDMLWLIKKIRALNITDFDIATWLWPIFRQQRPNFKILNYFINHGLSHLAANSPELLSFLLGKALDEDNLVQIKYLIQNGAKLSLVDLQDQVYYHLIEEKPLTLQLAQLLQTVSDNAITKDLIQRIIERFNQYGYDQNNYNILMQVAT